MTITDLGDEAERRNELAAQRWQAWRRRVTRIAAILAVALLTATAPLMPAPVEDAIHVASYRHGVSVTELREVVWCESRGDVWAIGDHGRSVGLIQLNRDYGLYREFVARGLRWDDPVDAIGFLAEQIARGRASNWSCWRILFG